MSDSTKNWKTKLAESVTDQEKEILLSKANIRSSVYSMSGSSSNPSGFVKLHLDTKKL